jgi:hypothetical protein
MASWLMAPWALHLAVDAPLHATEFFLTVLRWPCSSWVVHGIPWAQRAVLIPNVTTLPLARWIT